jgi:carbamoyl-phosphate synthase large subunit
MLKNDEIDMIINTTEDKQAIADSYSIRRTALQHKVFYTTTMAGAMATILALKNNDLGQVNRLQDLHKEISIKRPA